MKKLNITLGLLTTLLASTVNATVIAGVDMVAFADSAVGSRDALGNLHTFYNYSSNSPISAAQLTLDLTDPNSAQPDATTAVATYVLSTDPDAYVDMGFTGSNAIYNGAGADLALFFAGDFTQPDVFDIQINGFTRKYTPVGTPIPWITTDAFSSYNLTYALIELDDFGLANSVDPLSPFRVFLGDPTLPALSLVGGFHTSAPIAAVPLPVPALLFVSGLGLLGVFGRKHARS